MADKNFTEKYLCPQTDESVTDYVSRLGVPKGLREATINSLLEIGQIPDSVLTVVGESTEPSLLQDWLRDQFDPDQTTNQILEHYQGRTPVPLREIEGDLLPNPENYKDPDDYARSLNIIPEVANQIFGKTQDASTLTDPDYLRSVIANPKARGLANIYLEARGAKDSWQVKFAEGLEEDWRNFGVSPKLAVEYKNLRSSQRAISGGQGATEERLAEAFSEVWAGTEEAILAQARGEVPDQAQNVLRQFVGQAMREYRDLEAPRLFPVMQSTMGLQDKSQPDQIAKAISVGTFMSEAQASEGGERTVLVMVPKGVDNDAAYVGKVKGTYLFEDFSLELLPEETVADAMVDGRLIMDNYLVRFQSFGGDAEATGKTSRLEYNRTWGSKIRGVPVYLPTAVKKGVGVVNRLNSPDVLKIPKNSVSLREYYQTHGEPEDWSLLSFGASLLGSTNRFVVGMVESALEDPDFIPNGWECLKGGLKNLAEFDPEKQKYFSTMFTDPDFLKTVGMFRQENKRITQEIAILKAQPKVPGRDEKIAKLEEEQEKYRITSERDNIREFNRLRADVEAAPDNRSYQQASERLNRFRQSLYSLAVPMTLGILADMIFDPLTMFTCITTASSKAAAAQFGKLGYASARKLGKSSQGRMLEVINTQRGKMGFSPIKPLLEEEKSFITDVVGKVTEVPAPQPQPMELAYFSAADYGYGGTLENSGGKNFAAIGQQVFRRGDGTPYSPETQKLLLSAIERDSIGLGLWVGNPSPRAVYSRLVKDSGFPKNPTPQMKADLLEGLRNLHESPEWNNAVKPIKRTWVTTWETMLGKKLPAEQGEGDYLALLEQSRADVFGGLRKAEERLVSHIQHGGLIADDASAKTIEQITFGGLKTDEGRKILLRTLNADWERGGVFKRGGPFPNEIVEAAAPERAIDEIMDTIQDLNPGASEGALDDVYEAIKNRKQNPMWWGIGSTPRMTKRIWLDAWNLGESKAVLGSGEAYDAGLRAAQVHMMNPVDVTDVGAETTLGAVHQKEPVPGSQFTKGELKAGAREVQKSVMARASRSPRDEADEVLNARREVFQPERTVSGEPILPDAGVTEGTPTTAGGRSAEAGRVRAARLELEQKLIEFGDKFNVPSAMVQTEIDRVNAVLARAEKTGRIGKAGWQIQIPVISRFLKLQSAPSLEEPIRDFIRQHLPGLDRGMEILSQSGEKLGGFRHPLDWLAYGTTGKKKKIVDAFSLARDEYVSAYMSHNLLKYLEATKDVDDTVKQQTLYNVLRDLSENPTTFTDSKIGKKIASEAESLTAMQQKSVNDLTTLIESLITDQKLGNAYRVLAEKTNGSLDALIPTRLVELAQGKARAALQEEIQSGAFANRLAGARSPTEVLDEIFENSSPSSKGFHMTETSTQHMQEGSAVRSVAEDLIKTYRTGGEDLDYLDTALGAIFKQTKPPVSSSLDDITQALTPAKGTVGSLIFDNTPGHLTTFDLGMKLQEYMQPFVITNPQHRALLDRVLKLPDGEYQLAREWFLQSGGSEIPASRRVLAASDADIKISHQRNMEASLAHQVDRLFPVLSGTETVDASNFNKFTNWWKGAVTVWNPGFHCLSGDTEILTQQGWKNYKDVSAGDMVLAYDHGVSRWEPIEKMNIFPYNGHLLHFSGKNKDLLCTVNHRCLTTKGSDLAISVPVKAKMPLTSSHEFPDENPDFNHRILYLMGMIIGDGSVYVPKASKKNGWNPRWRRYTIYQSEKKFADKVRIFIGGDCSERIQQREGDPTTVFNIRGELGRTLTKLFPTKESILGIIPTLCRRQLESLVEGLMDAEGTVSFIGKYTDTRFNQSYGKNKSISDMFQELVILLGANGRIGKTCVSIKSVTVTPYGKPEVIPYKGKVWCPTVPSGFFWARRNGIAFPTGNSRNAGSGAFLYWLGGGDPIDLIPDYRNATYVMATDVSGKSMPEWSGITAVTLPSGEKLTVAQVRALTDHYGVTDASYTISDLPTDFQQISDRAERLAGHSPSGGWGKKITAIPRHLGQFIEGQGRSALFLSCLRSGQSPAEAALHVKKIFFDYGALPKTLKTIKPYVPFITWTSKNLGLQIEQLMANPGKYANLLKIARGFQDLAKQQYGEDWAEYVPEWLRGAAVLAMPSIEDAIKDTPQTLLRFDIPATMLMDIAGFVDRVHKGLRLGTTTGDALTRAGKEIKDSALGFVNPILSSIALVTGATDSVYDPFRERALRRDREITLKPKSRTALTFSWALDQSPSLVTNIADIFGLRWERQGGGYLWHCPETSAYLIQLLPPVGHFIAQFEDGGWLSPQNRDLWERVLQGIIGLSPLKTITIDRLKSELGHIYDLQKSYDDYNQAKQRQTEHDREPVERESSESRRQFLKRAQKVE